MRLGIDFGTTRTVVAACDSGNYPVVGFVGPGDGDPCDWFPSLVAERGGQLCFGLAAQATHGEDGWTIVRSFKRLLSAPGARPELPVQVGSLTLPLSELLARFLGALREAILGRSNLPAGLGGELEAVVAVPANAHGTQRFLTLDAFRRAGFAVRAMLNEPSAAGFEYTHRFRKTLSARREHIVVYDLGGGTFDASLVRMADHEHDAVTTAGVNQLGGDDFDRVLADLVAAAARLDLTPAARATLTERCRVAKEGLSPSSRRIVLDLEGLGGDEVTIAAADYYAACAPLVAETIRAMRPVIAAAAGLEGDSASDGLAEIAGIYVVGGASSLPVVGRVLREEFGRRVHRSPYSFAATAIGLAIAADDTARYQLTDRLSRHFGVFREADAGRRISFDPIFTPDTAVPAPGQAPLTLTRRYRAAHNLGHYRFLECAGLDADGEPQGDVTPFGDALFPFDADLDADDLTAVPVARQSAGPLVEERYSVDANGLVEVVIANLDTGYQRAFRLGS